MDHGYVFLSPENQAVEQEGKETGGWGGDQERRKAACIVGRPRATAFLAGCSASGGRRTWEVCPDTLEIDPGPHVLFGNM